MGRPVDHGFWEVKWLLRRRLIGMIAPGVAVDLFAGEGRLLTDLYLGFREVHAVERDPGKWSRLYRRTAGISSGAGPAVRTYCEDNKTFVHKRLPRIAGVNLLDFDAYGDPHGLIQEAFAEWRPSGRTAVAVTDGGRMALLRGGTVRPSNYLAAPGSGLARVRPLSAREYELLVRRFWSELARSRGLMVVDFMSAWRKGRRVLYYGVCIEPDGDRVD